MLLSSVSAFVPTPKRSVVRQLHAQPPQPQPKRQLLFSGDASASLPIEATVESVQAWLQSPESQPIVLGTTTLLERSQPTVINDNEENHNVCSFVCQQPSISFWGLQVTPIFIQQWQTTRQGVTVRIVDTNTDVVASTAKTTSWVQGIMAQSTFNGQSVIEVSPTTTTTTTSGCTLSMNLTLTLQAPLPQRVLIPPGFNQAGSAILRKTGRRRTRALLESLRQAYWEYHQQRQCHHNETQ